MDLIRVSDLQVNNIYFLYKISIGRSGTPLDVVVFTLFRSYFINVFYFGLVIFLSRATRTWI